ncbi:MAG: hypothetical protein LBK57_10735 [Clostridiales Family XIII bacterium]|nr:hypothetical protein [Clostridiales Family XIII bacterium]
MDYDKPENNVFKVVNQYSVQGDHLRRPDMSFTMFGTKSMMVKPQR